MRWKTSWIACCMVAYALSVHAQEWEDRSIQIPDPIQFYDVAVSQNQWIAVGTGGILRSTDDGETWAKTSSGNFRRVFFLNETQGWAVGTERRIKYTDDGGLTWTTQFHIDDAATIRGIAFKNELEGIAVGIADGWFRHGMVLRTIDGGETWDSVNVFFPISENNHDFLGVSYLPSGIAWVVGGWYADDSPLVYRSANDGRNWDTVGTPAIGWMTSVHFWNDTLGVIAGQDGQIFRTTNGGNSWDQIDSPTEYDLRDFATTGDSVIYAGCRASRVLVSYDYGAVWTERSIPGSAICEGIGVGNSGKIVVARPGNTAENSSLAISSDSGFTWSETPIEIIAAPAAIACGTNGQPWVVGHSGTIVASLNAGLNWTFQDSADGVALEVIETFDSQFICVAGEYGNFRYTSDGGANWITANPGSISNLSCAIMLSQDRWFLSTERGRVYETMDRGEHWLNRHEGAGQGPRAIGFCNPGNAWIVGDSSLVLRSQDDGLTWQLFDIGVAAQLNDLHCFTSGDFVAVADSGRILLTFDGGTRWAVHELESSANLNAVAFGDNFTGWAVGDDGTILQSTDAGASWVSTPPVTSIDLIDIAIHESEIYILGEGGLVLYASNEFSDVQPVDPVVPMHFSLSAYPNPFNSTATLQFELPRETRVEIILYDVLGRVALNLADEVYTSGAHTLKIDAASLTSGAYFANLRTPEFSTTQKLLLLR